MKSLKYISYAIVFVVMLGGCRGKDKLFVDPTASGTGTPATQLTEVEAATINSYEGDINRTGSVYIQHMVGVDGQGVELTEYALAQQEEDNNWAQLYATMNNAAQLRRNFGTANPYYDGITEILTVMNIGLTTDAFGDAPYSEALMGASNLYPHFDAQQTIYSMMQSMLDDAISKLAQPKASNAAVPTGDDLIFGGNVSRWTKTAYTLKARFLNRLSNRTGYDPAAVLAALAKGITSSSEDCMGTHDASNGQNQWYAYLNARGYLHAGKPLVDSMKKRPNDLRLYYYFDSSLSGGAVVGSPVATPDPDASYYGRYLAGDISNTDGGDPTKSTPMVTFMESKFIEAEARVRQSNNAVAATALNAAIQASSLKATDGDYDGSDIATYTTAGTNLSRVMYEKWIAMFGQTEAWNDYRRTKMPALTPNPNGAVDKIPERLPMSLQENNSNPNSISLPVTTPVWWAQ